MTRVLLMQPSLPPTFNLHEPFMPMSLAYIGAILQDADVDVKVIDLHLNRMTDDQVRTIVAECAPDYAGLTCTTLSYPSALKIADLIKESQRECVVVIGGPHVTFRARETLEESPAVDIVVRGEGDYALLDIISTYPNLHAVPGITFRDGLSIEDTPDRPLIANLDDIPFPARHLFPADSYQPAIVSSRGCTHRCAFCSAGAMSNKYRLRSVGSVVSELKSLSYGGSMVAFYDNTFSGNPQHALEMCRGIEKADLGIRWTCELRADTATDAMLSSLWQAGARALQFGVESGSDAVLRAIGKGISVDEVRRAVGLAISKGFAVSCSFTVGHAHDTEESIRQTGNLIREVQQMGAHAAVAIATPFPGTRMFEQAQALGLRTHDYDWAQYSLFRPVVSTRHLTREQIGQLFVEILLSTRAFVPASKTGA